jgi:DNA-binding FadR family transcriptional regulator
MRVLFTPIQNQKISERIITQFEELIHSQRLKPGDRLPSERELTEMFGVGRPTIREALQSLQMVGLMDVQQGRGSFIKELDFSSYVAKLRKSVNLTLISESVSLQEFYSGRKLIEPSIAYQVAEHHTAEDLERLED